MWTAKMVTKGGKYLVLQHGGGIGLEEMATNIEKEVPHKFLTWGWKDKGSKIVPFNSFKLSNSKKKIFNHPKKYFFICINLENKYSYGAYTHPRTNLDRIRKINSIKCLVDNLSNNLSNKIVLRYLKHVEKVVNYKFQEKIFNKKIKFDRGESSFESVISKGKLFLHTSNQTGFLETMFYNLPTILLLDKKSETFTPSSRKIIQKLEAKNVIHYDAKLASQFINDNFNNIEKWWFDKDLQLLRKKFCFEFVKQVKNPTHELKNVFKKLM